MLPLFPRGLHLTCILRYLTMPWPVSHFNALREAAVNDRQHIGIDRRWVQIMRLARPGDMRISGERDFEPAVSSPSNGNDGKCHALLGF